MTHTATGLSNAWSAAGTEAPKTTLYALTDEEWFEIRTGRGCVLTGQSAHRTHHEPWPAGQNTYVRGIGDTYYWCMGAQPDAKTIKLIARDCPVAAAYAYLEHYEYVPPGTWPQGNVRPTRRKP